MLDARKISLILLCLAAVSPSYAKSIKCVDAKGITHYGDSIPPECERSTVIELDDKGVPVKQDLPSLTPEQRQAMEAEVKKQASEAQQAKEKERKDKALLNSYSTASEIDMARDRNLQQLTLTLDSIESRLKIAKGSLAEARKNAAEFTNAKKPVPTYVNRNIAAAEKEVSELEVERVQKQQDIATMREKYESDKKRYLELTQPQQPAAAAAPAQEQQAPYRP